MDDPEDADISDIAEEEEEDEDEDEEGGETSGRSSGSGSASPTSTAAALAGTSVQQQQARLSRRAPRSGSRQRTPGGSRGGASKRSIRRASALPFRGGAPPARGVRASSAAAAAAAGALTSDLDADRLEACRRM